MKSLKQYAVIPIEACEQFKLKDLYLLAGLYINAPYKIGAEYMITDTTFRQLSDTTGVSIDYIKDSFIPKLKEKGYRVDTIQESYKIKGIDIICLIHLKTTELFGLNYSVIILCLQKRKAL